MKISPFLMSANKNIEYRVISAQQDMKSYIVDNIKTDYFGNSASIYRRDIETPEGKISIFHRRKVAAGFKDKQGRDIYRTDGICVSGADAEHFIFHPHYLEEAEQINDGHFKDFWQWTNSAHPTINPKEEIAFNPGLKENLQHVLANPPVDARSAAGEVGAGAATEKKTAESARSKRMGETLRKGGTTGKAGQEASFARGAKFGKVATVALGVTGLGLMGHGAVAALNARQVDGSGQTKRDWGKTALYLAEAGIGAGITWVGYTSAFGNPTGRGR